MKSTYQKSKHATNPTYVDIGKALRDRLETGS